MFFRPKQPSAEDQLKAAKSAYEEVIGLVDDTRAARMKRTRMAMLLRVHVDKTFVAGAEKTAAWQDAAAIAVTSGQPLPPEPECNHFQKVSSAEKEIWVYLPPETAQKIFTLGSRYQKTAISAQTAIDSVQAIADHLCRYELGIEEPFVALKFLRDELAEAAAADAAVADDGAAQTAASRPNPD